MVTSESPESTGDEKENKGNNKDIGEQGNSGDKRGVGGTDTEYTDPCEQGANHCNIQTQPKSSAPFYLRDEEGLRLTAPELSKPEENSPCRPNPCYSNVSCSSSGDVAVCGPCPTGYKVGV